MKKLLLFILFFSAVSSVYCQHLHVIRFIHEGEETKPVGNLVFSVEELMKVTGTWGDMVFGHSYKTDINTFSAIRNCIRISKYTVLYNNWTSKYNERYRIEDSNGKVYYLYQYNDFFHVLQLVLKQKKLDPTIMKFLSERFPIPK